MPIRKITDLQQMEDALWHPPGSPELQQAIRSVWQFARETCPQSFPPGVYKNRSLEEAQQRRDQWEDANIKKIRRLRQKR